MTMKVAPLNGNALVKVRQVKKIGSIFLPDNSVSQSGGAKEAELIAVSEVSKFTVGQVVILPDYSARTEITIDSETYFLCPEKDFLARIQ